MKKLIYSGWIVNKRALKNMCFIVVSKDAEERQFLIRRNAPEIQLGDYIHFEYTREFSFNIKKHDNVLQNIIYHSSGSGKYGEILTNPSGLKNKYRHLYLRKLQNRQAILMRNSIMNRVRKFYDFAGHIYLYTPILAIETEEGAKSFKTKSSENQKIYSLPQSPQIYKNIAMYCGFEKYYQIAPVFRDEPTRNDRLFGEFYQVDVEMAPISELQPIILQACRAFRYITSKYIKTMSFMLIEYEECIKKYKTDKPKIPGVLIAITKFPFHEYKSDGSKSVMHNPFTQPEGMYSLQFDLVYDGYEMLSGGVRNINWESFTELNSESVVKECIKFKELWSSGIPQHGGYAFGIDRIIQICGNLSNIEDSVYLPKNKSGKHELLELDTDE